MSRTAMFTQLVEAATMLAAAIIVQRGELTDEELRAMPLVGSDEIADAVRSRLVRHYGMRVDTNAIWPSRQHSRRARLLATG